jgi:hypothetical protein
MANLCQGVVAEDGTVLAGSVSLKVATRLPSGAAVFWSAAPERVRLNRLPSDVAAPGSATAGPSPPPDTLGMTTTHPAVVIDIVDLGATVEVTVRLNAGPELRSRSADPVVSAEGEDCLVSIDGDAVIVWPAPPVAA